MRMGADAEEEEQLGYAKHLTMHGSIPIANPKEPVRSE